jgi:hypothetical protein
MRFLFIYVITFGFCSRFFWGGDEIVFNTLHQDKYRPLNYIVYIEN